MQGLQLPGQRWYALLRWRQPILLVTAVHQSADLFLPAFILDDEARAIHVRTIVRNVRDHGGDTVAAQPYFAAAQHLRRDAEALHVLDTLIESQDVGLRTAKEHVSTIMPECVFSYPWMKEPPARARRSTMSRGSAPRLNQ